MRKQLAHLLPVLFLILCLPAFLFASTPITPSQQKQKANMPFFASNFTSHKFNNSLGFDLTPKPITICSAASIVIKGDTETPTPDTYSWEVLQGSTWLNAPGVNNTADYPSLSLVNNTSANILYSIRRKYITAGVVSYDSYYDVTVLPSAPITNNTINTPTVNSFCSPGNPATITGSSPAGGDGNFTYQWQTSGDNITFNNITGANASFYIPPILTATTYYRRVVSAGSCVAPSPSNAIGVVIVQPVTNNVVTAPAINTFCVSGDPAAISGNIPSNGDGTYTYQWQVSTDNINFTDISGATARDYDPSVISATTYYRRSAKSGVCTTPVLSNPIAITILPALSNNNISAPAVTAFCASGDAAIINGNLPSGGNGVYAYQWQQSIDNVSYTNISGANGQNYDPPLATVTTFYRRAVTSGACTTPLISSIVAITINPLPVLPVPVQATVSICSGSTATLAVSSPQAGVVYNWYDTPTKITLLASGTSYTTPAQTVNKTFYVESSNGTCASSGLAAVQVVIATPVAIVSNSLIAPAINSFCINSDPAAITGSIPTGGNGVYTYQWQSSTDNVNFTDISGATAKDFDPAVISVTTYFRRTVTSGACSTPVLSNVISISIFPSIAGNVLTAPVVNSFCLSGDPTIITGTNATGGNGTYSYQWQQSTDNVSFADIAGATLRDFDPAAISATTYYRRTVISGQCTTPLISNVITVTILPLPVVPVTTVNSVSICSGGTATFSINSPIAGITYNWYDSASKTILLASGTSFTTTTQTVNKTYYVESSNGTCSSSTLTPVQVIISTPVAIANNTLTAPTINSFCVASDPAIIIGASPTGGNGVYTYQWQSSTDNVAFADISGATAKDFDPALISATTYFRRITNSGGCAVASISNVVTISIFTAVANNTISAPAVTSFCTSGKPAIIIGSAPTGGNTTYTYQWQQSTDNVSFSDISGATLKDIDPATINTTTYYRRVVTSGQCTSPLISNVVGFDILTVPVTPTTTVASVSICPGSTAVLSVSSPQAGVTYNWYDSAAKTTLLFTGTSYTTPAQSASKTFYVESSNGTCGSSSLASVQVIVTPPPTAPVLSIASISACSGSVVTLSISSPQAGYTYNWYQSASGGTSIASGSNFTTPMLSANATYYAEATSTSGCISSSRTSATVTINALPQVTVQNASVCPGSNAVLSATADVSNATINWYTSATGGTSVNTGSTLTTPPLSGTLSYYVEVTNNTTGCISASRKLVQAGILQQLAAPNVKAGAVTMSSVTFNWDAVGDATGYKVSTDNGLTYTDPSSGATGLSHTVTGLKQNQQVSIVVKATGNSICQLSNNSIAVTANSENDTDDIFVANAFTPNGDGKNDRIYVHSEGIKSFSFMVYSQWGELIFNTSDINNGWDGTFKGAKEPAGVYVYAVRAIMNNGHSVNKKGTITLLK